LRLDRDDGDDASLHEFVKEVVDKLEDLAAVVLKSATLSTYTRWSEENWDKLCKRSAEIVRCLLIFELKWRK